MVIPPFLGQEVVRATPGLADVRGFVRVRPTYQSEAYDDVYAVGVAAAVAVPWRTPTPVGIRRTGFPTEVQAHTAARNIAAQIRGDVPEAEKPFDDILPPREPGVLVPGPRAHARKVAFEKYFLWKARHGYVNLP
jgi:sulfide:quinone oxidoreductase